MKFLKFAIIIALLLSLPSISGASLFTMNLSQLSGLYDIYSESATLTHSVNDFSRNKGIIFGGSMDPGGKIMIGASYHGTPSNLDLGMSSLAGYSGYTMNFRNLSDHELHYNLYFNVGYTGSSYGETNYYIETSWTQIGSGGEGTLILDFNNVSVWGGGYSGDWMSLYDLVGAGEANLDHISNIGFAVANWNDNSGSMFSTQVGSIPEPGTLVLLGLGLGGILALRRKFK